MIAYYHGRDDDILSWASAGTIWRPAESGLVSAGVKYEARQQMQNSGNEAKKYLKTKDITFLHAAICAQFERKFAPIEPQKEQKQRVLRKRGQEFGVAS